MASLNEFARQFRFAAGGKRERNDIDFIVWEIGRGIDMQIGRQVVPVVQCQVGAIKVELRAGNNRVGPLARGHPRKLSYTKRSTKHSNANHFRNGVDQ